MYKFLPVIAIVGRPNVGKSTLFNFLTRSRAAIVTNTPGVTRDHQFGESIIGSRRVLVVDTGGLVDTKKSVMDTFLEIQVNQAIKRSNCILFLADARTGLTPTDKAISDQLRKKNRKILLVINKADADATRMKKNEFYRLGLDEPYMISAKTGKGVDQLMIRILRIFRELVPEGEIEEEAKLGTKTKIAIIGRPNVGKSTLMNRLLGEERVIVCDQPGTTRDNICVPYICGENNYTLIDTAGIPRYGRIRDTIEKFAVAKSIQTIRSADVVVFVLDSNEIAYTQNLRLLNLIIELGTPLVIALNKWDALKDNERKLVKREIGQKMFFVSFACICFVSALKGTGIEKLFQAIEKSYRSVYQNLTTNQLTKTLEKAILEYTPPPSSSFGRRIHFRYAHLGSRRPLTIVIHGKNIQFLPQSYSRYLANFFQKTFNFLGTPIYIKLKPVSADRL
ncbi:ribosome biogenesis GTPase Der [Coxiella endosymbiont of Amblyomma sculptum]|uniref:ribosome biogenesis GTPase Der n=1 Tax=Coxiella endosymbiont of Amblyomma sculptum TaxID=2487929 RepID=UPI00132F4013|nr:ribosome biogenesis GTPase Der [Coxiella endosymbiont of Amblyomma sculptum]QHG92522.1 ribosome biogenesis GTPase Der [Coxiella endosymbiont of Amblyomma sculptum]